MSQGGQSWTALDVQAQTIPARTIPPVSVNATPPVPAGTETVATKESSRVTAANPAAAASDPAAATPAIISTPPVTPRANPLQISFEPSFGTDSERFPSSDGSVVFSSSFQELPLSMRYQTSSRDTLTLRLPCVRRQNKVSLGNLSQQTRSEGLGDIQVGYERVIARLNQSPWNATFGAGLGLPTGKSVYGLGPDETALGSGHYELSSYFDLGRVADPVILNAQVGLNYSVPRSVNGRLVSPGLGYSFSTGVGYAIDDRFVLSEQLSFSRRSNVFLLTPIDTQFEKISQAYLTQSLIYTPVTAKRVYRLSFTLGLNNASTDYILGLSVR